MTKIIVESWRQSGPVVLTINTRKVEIPLKKPTEVSDAVLTALKNAGIAYRTVGDPTAAVEEDLLPVSQAEEQPEPEGDPDDPGKKQEDDEPSGVGDGGEADGDGDDQADKPDENSDQSDAGNQDPENGADQQDTDAGEGRTGQ